MDKIQISHRSKKIRASINLPSSKSESNRILIIQALNKKSVQINNLSTARDTCTMKNLLKSKNKILNVLDAGTTMRFLTAYFTIINRDVILTGSERIKQRPIKILVDALRTLGGNITYIENKGFPPIHIHSFQQKTNVLSIEGNVSSQYISALLMIAPILQGGIKLSIIGRIISLPYIKMTLQLMKIFGIHYKWIKNTIHIESQTYKENSYTIESDWSGASYWYSIAALAKEADITLLGLRKKSMQGDILISHIMKNLGIDTFFYEKGIRLKKIPCQNTFEYDFTDCPDLAQTIAVVCAAKGIEAKLSGLKSLHIKETDRVEAIRREFIKLNIDMKVKGNDFIYIPKSEMENQVTEICTYNDHRMAMAFAPLALTQKKLVIKNPHVVSKSYKKFWSDLKIACFDIKKVNSNFIKIII